MTGRSSRRRNRPHGWSLSCPEDKLTRPAIGDAAFTSWHVFDEMPRRLSVSCLHVSFFSTVNSRHSEQDLQHHLSKLRSPFSRAPSHYVLSHMLKTTWIPPCVTSRLLPQDLSSRSALGRFARLLVNKTLFRCDWVCRRNTHEVNPAVVRPASRK